METNKNNLTQIIDDSSSKREVLQLFINWIYERVFANRYALSMGVQLFPPDEFANFNKLNHVLNKHLSSNKKYYYKCLEFVRYYSNTSIPKINFEDLEIAVRLIEDELIELALDTENAYKENYVKYKKVLFARYNNYDFDMKLANLLYSNQKICGIFFRCILNIKLEDVYNYDPCSHITNYIDTHNTVELIKALEDIEILPDEVFLEKLQELIASSIRECKINICFDSLLGIDSITNVLTDMESKIPDQTLNELIRKAKDEYIKSDVYNAIQTLWDIFERIKTLLVPENKKKSTNNLIEHVGNKLFLDNKEASQHTVDLLDKEFKTLTECGNKYNIRHSERDTFNVHNKPELLRYLIKRISSLLELLLPHVAEY